MFYPRVRVREGSKRFRRHRSTARPRTHTLVKRLFRELARSAQEFSCGVFRDERLARFRILDSLLRLFYRLGNQRDRQPEGQG